MFNGGNKMFEYMGDRLSNAIKNIKGMGKITEDYLNRIVAKMNKVEEGDETLILAEQLK